jgi:hypothetical protein
VVDDGANDRHRDSGQERGAEGHDNVDGIGAEHAEEELVALFYAIVVAGFAACIFVGKFNKCCGQENASHDGSSGREGRIKNISARY